MIMKICFVGNAASIHIHRWVDWFSNRGHEVFLASAYKYTGSNPAVNYISSKIQIPINEAGEKITSNKVTAYLSLFRALRKFLKKNEIDILNGHYIGGHGAIAAKTGFHPLVLSQWGDDIATFPKKSIFHKLFIRHILKQADLVHAAGWENRDMVIELGCDKSKILTEFWGVEVDRFSPRARSVTLRKKFLGENTHYLVTCVRAMEDRYQIPILIRAAPIVLSKKKDVMFLMVGDGAQKGKFEKMARDLGIQDNMLFIGGVPYSDMHLYYAISDIHVDPFSVRGFGVNLMEAMSTGVPIVVAERSGVEAGIKDGYNGYIVEGRNSEALAEKILKLLESDDKRRTFGKRSRKIILEKHDWGKNMNNIEDIYRKYIEKYRD
jgi:glycosyltransferase involved in cell wall biosynthesis